MSELFLKILNMSISASWLILAVLVLQLLLKKAPRWVHVLLWGFVAFRLVCPFTLESIFSLIPSGETVPMDIAWARDPAIDSGIAVVNNALNPVIAASFAPNPGDSANPLQILIPVVSVVWLTGISLMLLYTVITYRRLQKSVAEAIRYKDNIYQSARVTSPFVLGMFRPKIYLPFRLDEQDMAHILAHEQAHIRRKDHWWKPLGFALLTMHWFNPLVWLAYVLLCRDIELACDEKVIKELENEQRADYTQALVTCSVRRRTIAACPLAFGEVGVKERVKSVMRYRKPGVWIMVLAVLAAAVTALCFLTNPKSQVKTLLKPGTTWASEEHGIAFHVNENRTIEGTLVHDDQTEIISVGYRFAGAHNAVFDLFVGDWETAQASTEEPLLTGILSAKGRNLVLEIDQDHLGLGAAELVFVQANVTIIGGADGPTEIFVQKTAQLSLNDVISLSQKGYDLTWEDFAVFRYTETGSGLYIRVYEINEMYELWIGGTDTESAPMYIYLTLADDPNTKIDIRDGGVTEFLEQQNEAASENTDLQLQLILPKYEFEAGEPIDCTAVLTYVGEEDSATIFYNNPIVIFTLDGGEYFHGDRYHWVVRDVANEPAVARSLKRGEPLEIPFQKQQHWFTVLPDDTEKAFWEDYKATPELTLEPGTYEMIAHVAYSLKRVTAHGPFEELTASATITVK